MSGRPKQQVFVYNTEGKFIKAYESVSEFNKTYYPNDIGKRPLVVNSDGIKQFNDNLVACYTRIGRDRIVSIIRKSNSIFCKDFSKFNNRKVEALNLKNETIATFKNLRIAAEITKLPVSTIYKQVELSKGSTPKTELIFRYKQNEIQRNRR